MHRRRSVISLVSACLLLVSMGWSSASAAPPAQAGKTISTELSGANEVNAAGVPNQGDLDGSGSATIVLNAGQGTVCFEIVVSGIAPVAAAHIHAAPAGSNGGIVVGLVMGGSSLSGCVEGVDRELIRDILTHPSNYYVNVHNSEFPAGALRGQLG